MKILYTSGYTIGSIVLDEIDDVRQLLPLLEKPFVTAELGAALAAVLGDHFI